MKQKVATQDVANSKPTTVGTITTPIENDEDHMVKELLALVHFKDDEFDVATAATVEEAKELLAGGFDYIAEKDGIMLFRKPKRFKG